MCDMVKFEKDDKYYLLSAMLQGLFWAWRFEDEIKNTWRLYLPTRTEISLAENAHLVSVGGSVFGLSTITIYSQES